MHGPDDTIRTPVERPLVVPAVACPVSGGAHRDPAAQREAKRSVLAVIACAGVAGALTRYAASRLISSPAGNFPWNTFSINVSGCLAIGVVLVLCSERLSHRRLARPLLATGFLGAYTTFSTYVVDTDLLLRAHDIATGAIYALTSLAAGSAAVFVGVVATRALVRARDRTERRPH